MILILIFNISKSTPLAQPMHRPGTLLRPTILVILLFMLQKDTPGQLGWL